MRNINVVAIECMRELEIIGIPFGEVQEFTVNYRAERRWGQTKILPGGKFSININHRLLDESTNIDGLKSTIIHELLHTCKGCFNHGETWKTYAAIVKKFYGYEVKRCSSADEKGIAEENRCSRKRNSFSYNHKYVCRKCGQEIYRSRERGFVDRYKCGRCNGSFIKIY